jgi:hypothetical protein
MYDHLIRPRKRFYIIIPAVCIAAGFIIAYSCYSYIVNNWSDYATPYVFPGSHHIEFQEAGPYLVLYEYKTTVNDKSYSTTGCVRFIR